jgi:hypothetical protein
VAHHGPPFPSGYERSTPLSMNCKAIVKVQLRICDKYIGPLPFAHRCGRTLRRPVEVHRTRVRAFSDRFGRCVPGTRWTFSASAERMLPEYRSILGVTSGCKSKGEQVHGESISCCYSRANQPIGVVMSCLYLDFIAYFRLLARALTFSPAPNY